MSIDQSAFPAVPLGEFAERVSRSVDVVPGETYRTIGVRWWGEGAYEREPIDGSRTAAKTLSLVFEGDLIINKIWVRHGSVAIASAAVDGCAASGEFPTFQLDRERVEPRWIHWLTKTQWFWSQCDSLSRGTSGKNRIRPELFLTIPIPLPPLAEQRRIVARLDALAAKIERAQALRREAAMQAQAFVASLHNTLASGPAEPLGNYLVLDEDRVTISPERSYTQVGVLGFGQGLFPKSAVEGSSTTYKYFNRLYAGAVVLSQVKGWEGAIGVCPENLDGWFVSPEYRTFRCIQDRAIPEYLAAYVATEEFLHRLKSATRGVGARRERTRPEQFLEIEVQMPYLDLQHHAVSLFQRVRAISERQSRTTMDLDALLPSLLDRAFASKQ